MSPRNWLVIAAVLGGLSVALGAFGAHGLEGALERQQLQPEESARRLANWETAARYQMVHALALLAVAGSAGSFRSFPGSAAWCWLMGTAIFSGLLYALVLTGAKILGAIVPIGGVLLILGWLLVALAAGRTQP